MEKFRMPKRPKKLEFYMFCRFVLIQLRIGGKLRKWLRQKAIESLKIYVEELKRGESQLLEMYKHAEE
ncbi:MAG: hypothetical protein ACYDBV_14135 [Nitrospiria bacterium]